MALNNERPENQHGPLTPQEWREFAEQARLAAEVMKRVADTADWVAERTERSAGTPPPAA